MITPPDRLAAVIFDIDGTLLDSAAGIVAGFRHALRSVGFAPPSDAVLRSDLGPPVGPYFTSLGLDDALLERAVSAYRSYYRVEGMYDAAAYPGISDLLAVLSRSLVLGTATAKPTDTAEDILGAHDLAGYFAAITGTDDLRTTKSETIAHALELLGRPDPSTVLMVGDRHSDIAGGQACGLFSVGVTWGYGSRSELASAGADLLIDRPGELLDLVHRLTG
jgi:phosphoglycolate phosphatase